VLNVRNRFFKVKPTSYCRYITTVQLECPQIEFIVLFGYPKPAQCSCCIGQDLPEDFIIEI
jgi:hypothetical protein